MRLSKKTPALNMKYALILALWIVGIPLLISQEVDITLNRQLFEGALASTVVVSSDDGSVVHEFFLRKDEVEDDITFKLYRSHESQKLHLSICNEYFSPTLSVTFLRHVTKHDIEDDFYWESDKLLKAPKSAPLERPNPQDVKIYITGVDEVDDLITHFRGNDYRFKRKKGEISITGTHFPGIDLFILVKCNNEDQYRYIYLSSSEVESYLHFAYNDLSNQLAIQTLDFPFPPNSRFSTRAKCIDSGNTLYMHYLIDSQDSKLHIYAPGGLVLEGLNASVKPPQSSNTYGIQANAWEDFPEIWSMLNTELKAEWDTYEKELSFSEEVLLETDEFTLTFYTIEQAKEEQGNYNTGKIRSAGRIVKGTPKSPIKVVIPEIPDYYYNDLFTAKPYKLMDQPPTVILDTYLPEGLIKYYITPDKI